MPPPLPGEPQLWEEAYEAWWWLERYRLTPDQVDELPAAVKARVPQIAALYDEMVEDRRRRG